MAEINILIDSGKFNDITIEEVYEWIKKKKYSHVWGSEPKEK